MFDSTTVRRIVNTRLLASVQTAKLVWKLEHDGEYTVHIAYNYYVNNITESNTIVCERARHLITSWKQAQQTRSHANTPQPTQQHTNWEKPSRGRYKCNIDASFSSTRNKVGI
ncbi:polynucleotidyl transferase ribonuclease H fold, partial [Trifolium medium]|nr:polynucleotidyl transferase ribonuclease H fold [Trifolium medium]